MRTIEKNVRKDNTDEVVRSCLSSINKERVKKFFVIRVTWGLKRVYINGCRCIERLNTETEDQNCTVRVFPPGGTKNCCLLLIDKVRAKDKTYIWVSVRWKTKNKIWGIYTTRIHWVDRGTGTPKDKDDVNSRDVHECDGWLCVLEMMDTPSKLRVINKESLLWINKVKVKDKIYMGVSVLWKTTT